MGRHAVRRRSGDPATCPRQADPATQGCTASAETAVTGLSILPDATVRADLLRRLIAGWWATQKGRIRVVWSRRCVTRSRPSGRRASETAPLTRPASVVAKTGPEAIPRQREVRNKTPPAVDDAVSLASVTRPGRTKRAQGVEAPYRCTGSVLALLPLEAGALAYGATSGNIASKCPIRSPAARQEASASACDAPTPR